MTFKASCVIRLTDFLLILVELFYVLNMLVVIHTVQGFVVNEAEVDVLVEFPCFLYNLVDVGNLVSSSSAFSKPSLYIWKVSVHCTAEASLERFLSVTLLVYEMSAIAW